ncbi:MAG: hypothetical protein VX738_01370 [Planctomycetota bacterium]|nr:hypothetical protein [Planctomycetota bacterium]
MFTRLLSITLIVVLCTNHAIVICVPECGHSREARPHVHVAHLCDHHAVESTRPVVDGITAQMAAAHTNTDNNPLGSRCASHSYRTLYLNSRHEFNSPVCERLLNQLDRPVQTHEMINLTTVSIRYNSLPATVRTDQLAIYTQNCRWII